jgi:lysozyme
MTVRARWLAKYNTARLWAAIARRRYMWKPSEKNRAELERRRRQVEYALRVLKRHPAGGAQPAKGLDVSNLQGTIDFRKVKDAGYRFVWIKAGEGDWPDPNFMRNVQSAKAAGLKVGAYHFLRPKAGRTGAQEAKHFIERLKAAGLGKGDLMPALDVEATKLDHQATLNYVASFGQALRSAGFKPCLYTYPSFLGGKWSAAFATYPLWLAAYQSHEPTPPQPWRSYVCWQHASDAHVPGVNGKCDVDKTDDLKGLIA